MDTWHNVSHDPNLKNKKNKKIEEKSNKGEKKKKKWTEGEAETEREKGGERK